MILQGITGVRATNKMAHVAGYGPVWFDETLNMNIICLHNIKKIYHVEYNSKTENAFIL